MGRGRIGSKCQLLGFQLTEMIPEPVVERAHPSVVSGIIGDAPEACECFTARPGCNMCLQREPVSPQCLTGIELGLNKPIHDPQGVSISALENPDLGLQQLELVGHPGVEYSRLDIVQSRTGRIEHAAVGKALGCRQKILLYLDTGSAQGSIEEFPAGSAGFSFSQVQGRLESWLGGRYCTRGGNVWCGRFGCSGGAAGDC